jgi:hypothetical protein
MMNMPNVSRCEAEECAYNSKQTCHALTITIGHGTHPMCDTFTDSGVKGGDASATAKVGACKVDSCRWNAKLECSAPNITVSLHQGTCADCATFKQK